MKRIQELIYFLVFMLLISCGGNSNEYYSTILKSENGHLRGVSIGQSYDTIKVKESNQFLKSEKSDYLHYDYPIDMGNGYTVSYDFTPEDELYEIELNTFFDAIEDAQTLFADFEKFFNNKYGKGILSDDGFMIWKILSKGVNVEIAMKDESEHYGILNVKIYDLDY